MRECRVEDEALTREVHRLVCFHEAGGDPRSDLLRDADGISFFEVNLPHYFERNGGEETRRRLRVGLPSALGASEVDCRPAGVLDRRAEPSDGGDHPEGRGTGARLLLSPRRGTGRPRPAADP
jgi:hypothetical protein